MNRRQKRALMKRFPGYKDLLSEATTSAFTDFEEKFKKTWEKQGEAKTAQNEKTAEKPKEN